VTVRGDIDDRGSLSLELVIIVPMLLLMLALVYAFARVAQTNQTFEAGVRDAARAATQARSKPQAERVAEESLRASLGPGATDCLRTLDVEIPSSYQAGFIVTVDARCSYGLGDLGLPGIPGAVPVTASFASPLDPNRRVDEAGP
jgi:TadE-like protein